MDIVSVRLALAGLAGTPIDPGAAMKPVAGGWSAHVFAVAPDWIVRFPRDESAADRHVRERKLLPVVAASVGFAVPVVTHAGMHDGLPFAVHRRVPGAAPRRGQITPAAYTAALVDLHDVPPHAVTAAVGVPSSWRDRYRRLQARVDAEVLPILDPGLAARVAGGLAAFVERELAGAGPPRFVHSDLGASHILCDRDQVVGLIDFEDATLGDPAIDVVGIRLLEGAAFAEQVIRLHPLLDAGAASRLDFYTWMGAVHAILYGLDEDQPAEVEAGIAGLRERLPSSAGHR